MNPAELLVPAIRWDAEHGFDQQRPLIEKSLHLKTGGFIVFGGTSVAVRTLTAELRERSSAPLLIGADLERGAGQQFVGATGLPPLAALGSLADPDVMRRAGALTAREAREIGVGWVYAPVLDLDVEPDNPIIGTRAIGGDPQVVAELGAAWIEGCQSEHVLACAKHFPGHGRTTTDSHAELPVVSARADVLEETDLVPFRRAIEAGVASVMSAHVAFPSLDPAGGPATLSSPILQELLREKLGFEGLVVTDALIMAGVLGKETESPAAVRALAAGCDLLLYPQDIDAVLRQLESAIESGEVRVESLERAAGRRRRWAEWAAAGPDRDSRVSSEWAGDVACRLVHVVRGDVRASMSGVGLTVVDDDTGGPYPPPSRDPFRRRLEELGVPVSASGGDVHVVALFGDIRAWKGRPGYSGQVLQRVNETVRAQQRAGRGALIIQFSHPRLASVLPADVPIVSAWGGEAPMQTAAAEWLANRCGGA